MVQQREIIIMAFWNNHLRTDAELFGVSFLALEAGTLTGFMHSVDSSHCQETHELTIRSLDRWVDSQERPVLPLVK
jgi:hypothetical protein